MTKEDLILFEDAVVSSFEDGKIRGPIHLSRGNEDQLIEIFSKIEKNSIIWSTWRNHYHALLHGIPQEKIMDQILQGKSINICFPEYNFYTSAIVGGTLPIATGMALAIKRSNENQHVYCFIGDMAASCGMFHDCYKYAVINDLPITFVEENNFLSTNTPTLESWGSLPVITDNISTTVNYKDNWHWYYEYKRFFPHVGVGKFIHF